MNGSSSPSQEDLVDVKEEVRLLKIQAWLSRFFHFEKLQALSLSFFLGGEYMYTGVFPSVTVVYWLATKRARRTFLVRS